MFFKNCQKKQQELSARSYLIIPFYTKLILGYYKGFNNFSIVIKFINLRQSTEIPIAKKILETTETSAHVNENVSSCVDFVCKINKLISTSIFFYFVFKSCY